MPGDTDYDGPYEPGGWQNEPTETTPTSAAAFEQMVAGIKLAALRAGVSIRFDTTQSVTGLEQAQARANLGLGGAAVLDVGTTAGKVAAGDDSRFSGIGGGAVLDVFGRSSHVLAVAGDYTADLVYAAEQLDYACDLSNSATTIPTDGSQAEIAGGIGISVPATGPNRSLIIRAGGAAQITTAGAGLMGLNIYEITSGSVQIGTATLCGAFTVGTGSAFPSFPSVAYDLGPSTVERQFKLTCSMIRDASSTLAAKVRSSTTGVVRAYLEAMAA